MSKNISLKSVDIKPLVKKFYKRFGKHMIFAVLIAVLLVYLLIVFKISSLAKAEPGPDQEVTVTQSIPKVDKNAVNQIQKLEQSNTQIHSLFESARNNPFQE
jgi:predicted PurR-regulated permease PerM